MVRLVSGDPGYEVNVVTEQLAVGVKTAEVVADLLLVPELAVVVWPVVGHAVCLLVSKRLAARARADIGRTLLGGVLVHSEDGVVKASVDRVSDIYKLVGAVIFKCKRRRCRKVCAENEK